MTTPIGFRPMHSRPNKGQRVTVLMRDGTQLHDCAATMVYVGDRAGIVIYHNRKAVDESLAKGWWPVTPNAELRGDGLYPVALDRRVRRRGRSENGMQAIDFDHAATSRPLEEWHEDDGNVLWWNFPVCEPPYCGHPNDSDWPGYHTHWTPIVMPHEPSNANVTGLAPRKDEQ